jgi:hypothetical protein
MSFTMSALAFASHAAAIRAMKRFRVHSAAALEHSRGAFRVAARVEGHPVHDADAFFPTNNLLQLAPQAEYAPR